MKPFEKLKKMEEELCGLDYDKEALKQYLHIAQVMHKEEESYRKHRTYMLRWLKNIEEHIYDSVKKDMEL